MMLVNLCHTLPGTNWELGGASKRASAAHDPRWGCFPTCSGLPPWQFPRRQGGELRLETEFFTYVNHWSIYIHLLQCLCCYVCLCYFVSPKFWPQIELVGHLTVTKHLIATGKKSDAIFTSWMGAQINREVTETVPQLFSNLAQRSTSWKAVFFGRKHHPPRKHFGSTFPFWRPYMNLYDIKWCCPAGCLSTSAEGRGEAGRGIGMTGWGY